AILTAIDVENRRISLSIKEFRPNEWEQFAAAHQPGDILEGVVAKVADFGVFVRLPEGLEGLMHVSETDLPRGERPADHFREGEAVRVKILRIEPAEQRIGLSSRGVPKAPPPAVETPAPGDAAGAPEPAEKGRGPAET
ncbi:MAG: S1 RNA-binding domain-containing protein, partial [Acidithiobacillales bacterium]